MDFHGHINLKENELQKMILDVETSFPSSPVVGRMVFKEQKLYMCVGLNETVPVWVPVTNTITYYIHEESPAATSWTVTHDLNTTIPIVQIYDSNDNMIIPESVTPTSNNEMSITFDTAVSGKAIILIGDLIPESGIGLLDDFTVIFDLANASLSGSSLNVAPQTTFPSSLVFNDDGTKLFTVDLLTQDVFAYDLLTPYDVATMSYSGDSFDATSDGLNSSGLAFNSAGTKMFILFSSAKRVFSYDLSTAWDVTSASSTGNDLLISGGLPINPEGIDFSSDGLKMFLVGREDQKIVQYDLLSPYTLTGGTLSLDEFDFSSEESDPHEIKFVSNGKTLFMGGINGDNIYQYTLTSAYDLTTMSYSGISINIFSEEGNVAGIALHPDGSKMYIVGWGSDTVYEYV